MMSEHTVAVVGQLQVEVAMLLPTLHSMIALIVNGWGAFT
jgi:hypothetical protein